MGGWTSYDGMAVSLPLDNIDTDQLIPARFMSAPRRAGYGGYLLHDLRRDRDGKLLPDFPLNRHPGVGVLITGRNFGSGSSREAAVYALVDAGIRVVIAQSFGDIFSANAVNNGLLPARVSSAEIDILSGKAGAEPARIYVDLAAGEIVLGDVRTVFSLDETWRTKLMNGWDDIDLTLHHANDIAQFRATRKTAAPWAWLQQAASGATD